MWYLHNHFVWANPLYLLAIKITILSYNCSLNNYIVTDWWFFCITYCLHPHSRWIIVQNTHTLRDCFEQTKVHIQKQKLTDYINSAHLDRYLKLDLLDMLNSSPKHKKLCHGNLTPHNIIIKDDNIYVTDWNHASQGNASADVARTYLWMLINMPDYAENYLERFCNETNTSSKYVHNWIPIVAAARCAKNIPEEVKILNGLISVMEY